MHLAEGITAVPSPPARRAGTARLVAAIQELSLARSLDDVMRIVRSAARELSDADGATFVLRDGDQCFYADEDAIEPLWKGRRFPMSACISGWAMLNRKSAVIADIYADPRIPADAYRPTFVRSLAMVPIRTAAPIGAIGIYWARRRQPAAREVRLLQALADSTSIAIENVELYRGLEARVAERTGELARKNEELRELQRQKDELSALIVHDIKGPASAMRMCAQVQLRHGGAAAEREPWRVVLSAADRINRMALDLLDIARSESGGLVPRMAEVPLGAIFAEIESSFEASASGRKQRLVVEKPPPELRLRGDEELLHRVLYNLVDNSLRYAGPGDEVRVQARAAQAGGVELTVADTGPGIGPADRERVFEKYVRLGGDAGPQAGRGLGLTFCRLAVEAHGGRIRVEDNQPRGAMFRVLLPA
ncbi:MAG: sensor histidine kinase [Myxococcales bacterium]